MKFKVGDFIKPNEKAKGYYSSTVDDWRGVVIGVGEKSFDAVTCELGIENGKIGVKKREWDSFSCLDFSRFDLDNSLKEIAETGRIKLFE